ncbi:RIP metalloprotease RseP [Breznakiella homolactica]|uniref:Zinc metalloprotease n=1 Tax=Breznakiella homolactica TaxID=2798577 RepID=A0A7T7XKX3_9SPIR|nr:RIP metalloprotease RseP [Breznakiella homolactica]QQO08083.1 RIP metalloprotease RseP [Breznakiella homolactica]
MLLVKIILGLIGLGVVVFVHELGHFIAARLMGIEVEAFSIGWGKPILKKKIGAVEYRLGMFPIGGYCKMKGENEYQEALTNNQSEISKNKGTFYGASPWRRIVVSFAGPFANIIFAVLIFIVIWGVGFEVNTLDNRIVLVSDIDAGADYPADEAGLLSGDRIIEINGKTIENYHGIQESIAPNALKELSVKVDRDGTIVNLAITPSMDRSSGAGKIGVYFWTDPVVGSVTEGTPASIAGLRPDDRILRINGQDLPYSVALMPIMQSSPSVLTVDFERGGQEMQTDLVLAYKDDGSVDLGFNFKTITYHTPRLSPVQAIVKGAAETWKTFSLSVKSLALLFKGVDLTQAVSGPVRITYMVGDIATEGFGESFGAGLSSMANFLALISISLCIMNLLPIPVLDGGMIVLFIIEGIRRKPLNPKAVYAFQMVGVVLIFGLMIFAVFGDILFLAGRK